MPGETALFGFPYPIGGDKPAGPAQIEAAVKAVEERLSLIQKLTGTKATPVAPAEGQLLVVDNTGHAAYKAMGGDATINAAGVLTIGNEKVVAAKIAKLAVEAAHIAEKAVGTAKLADLAVTEAKLAALAVTAGKIAAEAVTTGKVANLAITTAKIALEAITTALIADGAVTEVKVADGAITSRKHKPTTGIITPTETLNLGEAYADVPGTALEITPAVASYLKITAVFEMFLTSANSEFGISGGRIYATISVDGVDQPTVAFMQHTDDKSESHWETVSQVYLIPLTAAKHTIKMRARKEQTTNQTQIIKNNTQMIYELFAS